MVLVADNLAKPSNVGSLFRLSAGFGIEHIYLCGITPVPPNRKLSRTSRRTERHVAFSKEQNVLELVEDLKKEGYTIIALEITDDSIELQKCLEFKLDKIALILGAEAYGVQQDLLDIADYCVQIPMFGKISSLNVSNATAITVYELSKVLRS